MDGTYVPETAIKQGDSEHFFYSLDSVSCKNPERVKDRNKRKSEVMDYLLAEGEIGGIPYGTLMMVRCNRYAGSADSG